MGFPHARTRGGRDLSRFVRYRGLSPGAIPVDADEHLVAVFSASLRKGRRRAGRRIHADAIFGSVEIDLSEALFEYRQVMIKAISVFGSVEVRVPENVSLRGSGGGVLGSFEVH